ncbi:MAG: hypothetical protein BGP24_13975 [Lysobacterales bacterium 69-70]|nr:DUF4426 domain-containing protein [Xanthomonadaceae bacterium]ODU35202.1 MAG: hypothetical protein ABS97_04810 [Xanthomonadaceae bacterium SCN 69-320]ODV15794.1 MAG: hypothetical protein ABT27_21995 [Xanthomonadaceae bacterium SCN 69-25]OJY94102.1 MAG: hypothetical protein BGP24_13975 [Xanthomonadales bacterium 69-70]
MKLAYKIGLLVGAAVLLFLLPSRGRGEQLQRFDDYVVHYNALSADMLPAEVAAAYKIPRSSKQGLLNIAVQRTDGAEPVAVTARISGSVANLAGQRSEMTVREIREADAIYYLAEFPVRGSDTLNFDLRIAPTDSTRSYTLKFSKNYVTE